MSKVKEVHESMEECLSKLSEAVSRLRMSDEHDADRAREGMSFWTMRLMFEARKVAESKTR